MSGVIFDVCNKLILERSEGEGSLCRVSVYFEETSGQTNHLVQRHRLAISPPVLVCTWLHGPEPRHPHHPDTAAGAR